MFLNNYLVIRGKYLPGASEVSEMDVVASLKVLPLLLRKAVLLYLYERQAFLGLQTMNEKNFCLFLSFCVRAGILLQYFPSCCR